LIAPAVRMVAPLAMHGFIYEPESAGHQVTVPTPLLHTEFASSPALWARLMCSTVFRWRDGSRWAGGGSQSV
jgi:hypothetical protein